MPKIELDLANIDWGNEPTVGEEFKRHVLQCLGTRSVSREELFDAGGAIVVGYVKANRLQNQRVWASFVTAINEVGL